MQLGDRHDLAAGLELAPQAGDAGADRRLGDRRAVLIDEPLPDPPRRVPLLAGRAQVGDEPLPDDLHVRTELRRRSGRLLALRRQRRLQRLPYRAPVHVLAARQLAYGQPLLSPCPSDMLEQLHPRHTPLLSLGGGLSRPSVAAGWVGGGATSEDQNGSRWGQIRVAFPGSPLRQRNEPFHAAPRAVRGSSRGDTRSVGSGVCGRSYRASKRAIRSADGVTSRKLVSQCTILINC